MAQNASVLHFQVQCSVHHAEGYMHFPDMNCAVHPEDVDI